MAPCTISAYSALIWDIPSVTPLPSTRRIRCSVGVTYDSAGNWLGQHAFLWTNGTMRDLGTALCLDESGSPIVPSLNDAGQVVGCRTHVENGVVNGNRAFLYQNGAIVDLNTLLPADSGLLLENALAVNNRGQITAFGTRTTAAETYQVYVLLTPVRR